MSGRGAAARALLVAMIAFSLMLGVTPANGVGPDRAGWWWQPNSGVIPVAVPPPPGTPPGGLLVAIDPGGERAIGAVHLSHVADVPKTLTLVVASQVGTPSLQACAVTGAWEAADGGAWDDRPDHDCAKSSKGTQSADGTSISFDITALSSGGAVDVAVIPDPGDSVATFQVAFEKPGDDAFSVEAAPTTVPPPAPPTTALAVSTDPEFISPSAAPVDAAEPAVPSGFAPLGAPSPVKSPVAGGARVPTASSERPLETAWVRFAAAAIFALLVASFLVSNGVITRGSASDDEDGEDGDWRGLGRFRQARVGAAPPV